MANYFTTPNMDLTVPYVNVDPGPDYANNINNSFSLIDSHDHSSGKGVQITPSGLNINAALTLNGNPLTNASYVEFQLQLSNPGVSQGLYVQNGSESPARPDLWYYDGSSAVQLTNNGSVNATIANLPGESYGAGTFTWKQGVGSTTPAAFDIGAITLRPNVAGATNGITLQTGAISSAWTLTLPTLPSATSFLTVDSSGNISSATALDGALTTANLSASAGILGSQLANNTVTPANCITPSTFVASTTLGSTVTNSNTTATITYTPALSIAIPAAFTTSRPIYVVFTGTTDGDWEVSATQPSNVSASTEIYGVVQMKMYAGPTTFATYSITCGGSTITDSGGTVHYAAVFLPANSISFLVPPGWNASATNISIAVGSYLSTAAGSPAWSANMAMMTGVTMTIFQV